MARQGVVPARKTKRKPSKRKKASIGAGVVPPRRGPHASLYTKRVAAKKKTTKSKRTKKATTRKRAARRSR